MVDQVGIANTSQHTAGFNSPPKRIDVDPLASEYINAGAQSPDEDTQYAEGDGAMDHDERPGYDVQVNGQEQFLPIANVARIMKSTMPANAKISKDAKEAVQEAVSEFISFITSEAAEKCLQDKRKTLNGEDIIFAFMTLGFDHYGAALQIYLDRYREYLNDRAGRPRSSVANGSRVSVSGSEQEQNGHEQTQQIHRQHAQREDATTDVGPTMTHT